MRGRLLKIFLWSVLGLVLLVPVAIGLLAMGLPVIAVIGLLAIPAVVLLAVVGIPVLALVIIIGGGLGLAVGAIGAVFGFGLAILRVAITLLVIAAIGWVVFKLFARRERDFV